MGYSRGGLSGGYDGSVLECPRRGSRSNWRSAVVRRKPLLRVITGSQRMLSLGGCRPNMPVTTGSLFLRRGARADPAVTAVVADAVAPVPIHTCVVNVVHVDVHVIQRRVVEETPVLPASAFITTAKVTEAIVDTTIESY